MKILKAAYTLGSLVYQRASSILESLEYMQRLHILKVFGALRPLVYSRLARIVYEALSY